MCTQFLLSLIEKCTLVTHKQIRSGQRPFCCGVCKKGFVRQADLMVHTQILRG